MSLYEQQREEGQRREAFGGAYSYEDWLGRQDLEQKRQEDEQKRLAPYRDLIARILEQKRQEDEQKRLAPYRDLIARIENLTFEDTVNGVLAEVADLIVDRQRTYGPANIEQQGIFGIVNRIGNDKLARIRQRLQGEIANGEIVLDPIDLGSVDQPGIINDLADVIGYAVCGILLLRGEWGRPLERDA